MRAYAAILVLALGCAATGCLAQGAAAVAEAVTPAIEAAFAVQPGTCTTGEPARPVGFAEDIAEPPDRPRLTVTSANDQDPHQARPEPGTLRWALAEARRRGGARIAVDPALTGARITLAAPLFMPPSTSLDGGCTGLTLDGDPPVTLLVIRDTHDVAVRQLRFERARYDPDSKTAKDAITLSGRFDNVVIDGNRFARCGDGCIDIVHVAEGGQGHVTIARNLFRDHNKVMLFGNNPCLRADPEPGCERPAREEIDGLYRARAHVSVVGNVFWGTGQRHPNVNAQVFVHAANNLIALRRAAYRDGRRGAESGMAALNGGFLLASDNMVLSLDAEQGSSPTRAFVTLDRDDDPQGRRRGFLRAERNRVLGAMRVEPSDPDAVPAPAYRRPIPELSVEGRDPVEAARCLVAGLRPGTKPNAGACGG